MYHIKINKLLNYDGKKFTLLHEMGHTFIKMEERNKYYVDDPIELYCDYFAKNKFNEEGLDDFLEKEFNDILDRYNKNYNIEQDNPNWTLENQISKLKEYNLEYINENCINIVVYKIEDKYIKNKLLWYYTQTFDDGSFLIFMTYTISGILMYKNFEIIKLYTIDDYEKNTKIIINNLELKYIKRYYSDKFVSLEDYIENDKIINPEKYLKKLNIN